jgi:type I restriction enzyme S subunit
MEFIEKRAKELYISSSGLSKSADQFGYGYPFLSYSDIFHNYYVPDELKTMVNSNEKDRENCSVKRGDVFLTRTSETTEELGMSCVALQTIENATFNGFAKRLRPISDEIVPEYAAYFFRSPYFRGQCMGMASLITRASLNDSMISRLKIRYPKNKSEQVEIGNILMSYDKLINNNVKRIKVLESMSENIYKEWFVRFRFPGYEAAKIKNGLPCSWEIKKVKDLVERLPYGKLYKLGDIQKEGEVIVIDQSTDEYVGFHSNEPSHMASLSAPIALFGDHSCKLQLMIMPFSLMENIIPYKAQGSNYITYLYYVFYGLVKTTEYKRHWSEFMSKKVLVAPNVLQARFVETINPILELINKLKIENRNLIIQRDLLLPRLMSGKLEIN